MPPIIVDICGAEDLRDVVHRAVQTLAEGGLVAMPTETVYGLAASGLDAEAVQRLLHAKGRKANQPLALGLKSADDALDYLPNMVPLARRLARRCWPGPVTLVADDNDPDSLVQRLPERVRKSVVPEGTLGVRVPAHPMILDVMRMLPGPIVLTSANCSGEADAVDANEVVRQLGNEVALVLDDGPCHYGQPSSVVRVHADRFEVLRDGVVSHVALQRLASMMILFVCTGNTCRSPMAKATMRKHIARRIGCQIDELADRGVIVESAGLAAGEGAPATPEAVSVMRQCGLALEDHLSQPLTEHLVRYADMVFAMTRGHRDTIIQRWPEAAARVKLLSRDGYDVSDPIGGTREVYLDCAKQIETEIAARAEEIELAQVLSNASHS